MASAIVLMPNSSAASSETTVVDGQPISDPSVIPRYTLSPDTVIPPPPELDATQREKLAEFRAVIPTFLLAEDDSRYAAEKAWCSDRCLLRYLRATKWHVPDAKKKLHATLVWRRSYRADTMDSSEVEPEALTGKLYLSGFDKQGRPILYMKPARENSKQYERMIRHVVFYIERAIRLMPAGVEKLVILVDFLDSSVMTGPRPTIAKDILHILHAHYPERLGMAFLVHTPWFFWPFFKVISPFIDPVSRAKVRFVDLKGKEKKHDMENQWAHLLDFIPADQLEVEFNGIFKFKYEHAAYWKTLLNATKEPKIETW